MIVVTGATGVVGGRIAERLAKRGIAQRLLVRNYERASKLLGAEIGITGPYSDIFFLKIISIPKNTYDRAG